MGRTIPDSMCTGLHPVVMVFMVLRPASIRLWITAQTQYHPMTGGLGIRCCRAPAPYGCRSRCDPVFLKGQGRDCPRTVVMMMVRSSAFLIMKSEQVPPEAGVGTLAASHIASPMDTGARLESSLAPTATGCLMQPGLSNPQIVLHYYCQNMVILHRKIQGP